MSVNCANFWIMLWICSSRREPKNLDLSKLDKVKTLQGELAYMPWWPNDGIRVHNQVWRS